MNVLVILGHPANDSLCGAIAEAYADGAADSGQRVEILRLGDLDFDINYPIGREDAPEEPDIDRARSMVRRADHLVFVFPNWWGTMPALMKGFIDRIFKPGFSFHMHADGSWDKLLTGKSAQLITTMDTPHFVYRWIYGQPGINALRKATFQFCGIHPVRSATFGTVFNSTPAQRERWLNRARELGLELARGVPDRGEKFRAKTLIWIKAMRLQFYPMTWFAYTVGAMAVGGGQAVFGNPVYWLGYAVVFLLEFGTVLANEYFDYDSDSKNRNASPFNGGSRVLVTGELSFREVRLGIALTMTGFLLGSLSLITSAGVSSLNLGILLFAALILCMGYTVPPLKLSHRGIGEFDVALTHSFLVMLFGWVLMGGSALEGFPWLTSVPLFLSILPAIMLSGLPDREADSSAGKRTLAVTHGPPRLVRLAMAATVASALTSALWHAWGIAGGVYAGAAWFVIPHAVLLLVMLHRYRFSCSEGGRIDTLMMVSLSYILWFVAIPFIHTLQPAFQTV
jgi:1,4-dihydroxy-2-naphthoate polyprenyltransferase